MVYLRANFGSEIDIVVSYGAEIAIGILESEYTPDMSESKAKDLVVKSIKAAC